MVVDDESCPLPDGNGTILRAMIPISETTTGKLHYKASVYTLGGSDFIQYPADGAYYELDLTYREAYGSLFGSLVLFTIVAGTIWGSLGVCLRIMLSDQEESIYEASAVLEAEAV
jgi:hypothetical protein